MIASSPCPTSDLQFFQRNVQPLLRNKNWQHHSKIRQNEKFIKKKLSALITSIQHEILECVMPLDTADYTSLTNEKTRLIETVEAKLE